MKKAKPRWCNQCDYILFDYDSLEAECSLEGRLVMFGNGINTVITIPKWCFLQMKKIEYKECWKCIEYAKIKEPDKVTYSICKKGHALWFPDQCPAYTSSQTTTVV